MQYDEIDIEDPSAEEGKPASAVQSEESPEAAKIDDGDGVGTDPKKENGEGPGFGERGLEELFANEAKGEGADPEFHEPDETLDGEGNSSSYALTRYNVTKHGIFSKVPVLPWENPAEYEELRASLFEEYEPSGPMENHLLNEIADIIWRKYRPQIATLAAHQQALARAIGPDGSAAAAALAIEGSTVAQDVVDYPMILPNEPKLQVRAVFAAHARVESIESAIKHLVKDQSGVKFRFEKTLKMLDKKTLDR